MIRPWIVVAAVCIGSQLAHAQWDWKPDNFATKKPYTLLGIHKTTDLSTGETVSDGSVDLAKPGAYVLDFYLPDRLFYTFPFTVEKVGSDDPFGGGDIHVLNGDWETCGCLYYAEAKAERPLSWKVWVRNKAAETLEARVQIQIKRDSDGTLVCTNRTEANHRFTSEWVRHEFGMIFPPENATAGAYFKAQDLLATDGELHPRAFSEPLWRSPPDFGELSRAVATGVILSKFTGRRRGRLRWTPAAAGGGRYDGLRPPQLVRPAAACSAWRVGRVAGRRRP